MKTNSINTKPTLLCLVPIPNTVTEITTSLIRTSN